MWTLHGYALGFMLCELVELARKFLSVAKRLVFFLETHSSWFLSWSWQIATSHEIFWAIVCRVDHFYLGFFSIETRGGSIARCSSVGYFLFYIANWCAQCMTTSYTRHHSHCFNWKHLCFWGNFMDFSN